MGKAVWDSGEVNKMDSEQHTINIYMIFLFIYNMYYIRNISIFLDRIKVERSLRNEAFLFCKVSQAICKFSPNF